MTKSVKKTSKKVAKKDNISIAKLVKKFHNSLPDAVYRAVERQNNAIKNLRVPDNYQVMLGFEIECLSKAGQVAIAKAFKKAFPKDRVITGWRTPANSANVWRIHGDGSVRVHGEDAELMEDIYGEHSKNGRYNAIEVSSKAAPWDEAWINLFKAIYILSQPDIEAYTNKSCGLHMSISVHRRSTPRASYKNVTRHMRYVDLLDFLKKNEASLLNLWDRNFNNYCHPIAARLANSMERHSVNWCKKADGTTTSTFIMNVGEKYQTFNIGKLHNNTNANAYIECRIPGGDHCHLSVKDAHYTMSIFGQMLLSSIAKSFK